MRKKTRRICPIERTEKKSREKKVKTSKKKHDKKDDYDTQKNRIAKATHTRIT